LHIKYEILIEKLTKIQVIPFTSKSGSIAVGIYKSNNKYILSCSYELFPKHTRTYCILISIPFVILLMEKRISFIMSCIYSWDLKTLFRSSL